MEPEGSLPHSQASANCLYPGPAKSSPYLPPDFVSRASACFLTWVFYREGLLAPRPTPKLKDHPLSSAVRDCLFNIFTATLLIGGLSSIRNLRKCHAVVTDPQITSYNWKLTCYIEHGQQSCLHQTLPTASFYPTSSVSCGYFVLHWVSALYVCAHANHILSWKKEGNSGASLVLPDRESGLAAGLPIHKGFVLLVL